jgi:hypothetical protein
MSATISSSPNHLSLSRLLLSHPYLNFLLFLKDVRSNLTCFLFIQMKTTVWFKGEKKQQAGRRKNERRMKRKNMVIKMGQTKSTGEERGTVRG